jgi:hypothetical protein
MDSDSNSDFSKDDNISPGELDSVDSEAVNDTKVIDLLEEELAYMAISSVKKGKLLLSLPTLIYTWEDSLENEHCSVDVLLLGTCTVDQLNVTVDKTGKNLWVEDIYPCFFVDPNRLYLSSNGTSNPADHKSISFNKTVRRLNSHCDDQNPKGVLICGSPFKCDRSLFWDENHNGIEVVCYNSGETVETVDGETHIQFYYVLQLQLLRADKTVKKAYVNMMRVVRSPGAGVMTQVSDDEDNTNNNYDFDE